MQYQLCIYVQLILHPACHAWRKCLRRLFLHCMVVAIRLTYGSHPSPRSRGGCFVPDRAESTCLSYRPAHVFCHNSDIVVDTYALPSGRQPLASEIGLRHLLLCCTVFAIRLTYGFEYSPRSRGGCFVPGRAESSFTRSSYRPCRHLLPCARSPHSAVCSM